MSAVAPAPGQAPAAAAAALAGDATDAKDAPAFATLAGAPAAAATGAPKKPDAVGTSNGAVGGIDSGLMDRTDVADSGANPATDSSRKPARLWFQAAAQKWRGVTNIVMTVDALQDRVTEAKVFGKDAELMERHLQRKYHLREPFMGHPEAPWRKPYNLCLALAVILTLFWTPFELAFSFGPSFSAEATMGQNFWAVMETVLLIFFVVDIGVNFRTAVYEDGELIQEPRKVARIYLRSWFAIDLLATIPFDLIASAATESLDTADRTASTLPRMLRFLRLVKLTRIVRIFKLRKMLQRLTEMSVFANHMLRFTKIAFYIGVVGHVMGCGWYLVGTSAPEGEMSWLDLENLTEQDGVTTRYVHALYWAFVTVSTVGYGDVVPANDYERAYVICATLVGNLVFAFMVGKVTSLAYQVDAQSNHFNEKMEEINSFLRFREVPKELRERVRSYYETFWNRGLHFDEGAILQELSHTLRKEMSMFLNRDIVRGVPLFKGADEMFTDELVSSLKLVQVLPEDVLMSMGDVGRCLYIVRRGAVMVQPICTDPYMLSDGAFMGEVSIVYPSLRRTCTAIARVPTELATLSKQAFEKLCVHYPNFREVLRVIALTRLEGETGISGPAAVDEAKRLVHNAMVDGTSHSRRLRWLHRVDTQGNTLHPSAHDLSKRESPEATAASTPLWLRKIQKKRSGRAIGAEGTPKHSPLGGDDSASSSGGGGAGGSVADRERSASGEDGGGGGDLEAKMGASTNSLDDLIESAADLFMGGELPLGSGKIVCVRTAGADGGVVFDDDLDAAGATTPGASAGDDTPEPRPPTGASPHPRRRRGSHGVAFNVGASGATVPNTSGSVRAGGGSRRFSAGEGGEGMGEAVESLRAEMKSSIGRVESQLSEIATQLKLIAAAQVQGDGTAASIG